MHLATVQTGDEPKIEQSSPEWKNVEPQYATAVWQQVRPMVERGLRHGQGDGTTPEAMLGEILLGKFKLWAFLDGTEVIAIVVFRMMNYVTGKKIWIDMLAGDGSSKWADSLELLFNDLKDLTESMCVETSARPGLAKILKKRGWREKATIMELR